MPRRPRADEAGGLYRALYRGNARQTIFRKDADYAAFEKILSEEAGRNLQSPGSGISSHTQITMSIVVDGMMER